MKMLMLCKIALLPFFLFGILFLQQGEVVSGAILLLICCLYIFHIYEVRKG